MMSRAWPSAQAKVTRPGEEARPRAWGDGGGVCVLSPFAVPFVRLLIFAVATLDFRGFKILVDVLKTGTLKKGCGHITYTITLAFCIFTFSTGGNSKVFITELSYIH